MTKLIDLRLLLTCLAILLALANHANAQRVHVPRKPKFLDCPVRDEVECKAFNQATSKERKKIDSCMVETLSEDDTGEVTLEDAFSSCINGVLGDVHN